MNLEPILSHLAETRSQLLRQADAFAPEQWKLGPPGGGWSAGEIIAHLIMVETKVVEAARQLIAEPPRRYSFVQRLGLPPQVVRYRLVRARSPLPLDAALVGDKEHMLGGLRESRRATLALLKETSGRDLSAWGWPHPLRLMGVLNFYEWFELVGHHEVRHTKQLQEIIESFQN